MSNEITVEQLTKLMEYGTLHGRIENWVLQTSKGNSQQLKIYSEESYRHNSENTCLRARMRAIFSFAMSQYHPNVNPEFSSFIRQLYLSTIYLFPIGTILFTGQLSPRDVITFEELEPRDFTLQCFRNSILIHEVDLKIIDETFNTNFFYQNLFNLIQLIPVISTPAIGMVYASTQIPISGYLEEL